MTNHIKINGIGIHHPTAPRKETTTAPSAVPPGDVTINAQIKELASLSVSDTTETSDTTRVTEIKQLINHNQYKVDVDALANKLSHSIII